MPRITQFDGRAGRIYTDRDSFEVVADVVHVFGKKYAISLPENPGTNVYRIIKDYPQTGEASVARIKNKDVIREVLEEHSRDFEESLKEIEESPYWDI